MNLTWEQKKFLEYYVTLFLWEWCGGVGGGGVGVMELPPVILASGESANRKSSLVDLACMRLKKVSVVKQLRRVSRHTLHWPRHATGRVVLRVTTGYAGKYLVGESSSDALSKFKIFSSF